MVYWSWVHWGIGNVSFDDWMPNIRNKPTNQHYHNLTDVAVLKIRFKELFFYTFYVKRGTHAPKGSNG